MKKIYITSVSIMCALVAHSSDIDHLITHTRTKALLHKASAIHHVIKKPLLTPTEIFALSHRRKEAEDVIQKQTAHLAILQTKQTKLEAELQDVQDDAQCPTCGARVLACISVTSPFVYLAAQTQNVWNFLGCTATALLAVPVATVLAGVVVKNDLTEKARGKLAEHTVQTKALESALEQYTLKQGLVRK
ncbi:hypothetical protein EBQ93_02780 [bacterium]|nr:hypothetical protein [bacterium]